MLPDLSKRLYDIDEINVNQKCTFGEKKLITKKVLLSFVGPFFCLAGDYVFFCCLWSLDKVAKCTHFLATFVTLTTHPEAQKEQSKKLLPAPHFFTVRQNHASHFVSLNISWFFDFKLWILRPLGTLCGRDAAGFLLTEGYLFKSK